MDRQNITVEEGFESQNIQELPRINLADYLTRLLENWVIILVLMVLSSYLLWGYTFSLNDPVYSATSQIYVLDTSVSVSMANLQFGSYIMDDYMQVFDIWEVHDEVRRNLELDYNYAQMRSMLNVTNPSGTRMLLITASSTDPGEAADLANEYAEVVSDYIANTMKMDRPTIMSVALEPTAPSNWHGIKSLAIAAGVGMLLGMAIVFVVTIADDKIKTAEDVRRNTGWTTLAVIPDNIAFEQKRKGRKHRKETANERD